MDSKEKAKLQKLDKLFDLMLECTDVMVNRFCSIGDPSTWDLKIKVLTQLNNGAAPADIREEEYYGILDKYPGDDEIWD